MTMKSFLTGLLTALFALGLHAAVYEKYLTPGVPLDDKILKAIELLKTDPKSSDLHNALGAYLQEKRFPNDAIQEFKKAVKLDKKNYRAWFNMGLARESEGQFFRAMLAYKKSLHSKSGFDLAHYHLGMIYERWGFRRAAIKRYALAIHYNPRILETSYNPAIAYNRILPEVLWYIYDKYRTSTMQPYQIVQLPASVPAAKPAVKPAEPPKKPEEAPKQEAKPAEPAKPAEKVKPAENAPPPPAAAGKQMGQKRGGGNVKLQPVPVSPVQPSLPPEEPPEEELPSQPPSSPVQPMPPDAQEPQPMPSPDQQDQTLPIH
jgi:tetratricopeptide (TPR) repeat protein